MKECRYFKRIMHIFTVAGQTSIYTCYVGILLPLNATKLCQNAEKKYADMQQNYANMRNNYVKVVRHSVLTERNYKIWVVKSTD